MKTTLLALVLITFLVPGISIANPGGHHERMIEHMDKELGLTDEQRNQVETVFDEQRTKFQALRDETETKLDAILNAEQKAKMKQMKAERKARWEKKREEWQKQKTAE